MSKFHEDVHVIAEAYLKEIGANNIPVVQHHNRFKQVYYGETVQQFTKRIEVERQRRYEIEAKTATYNLQSGKKYFYGFNKYLEAKWTYDARLAMKLTDTDVAEMANDLENLGFTVTKLVSPESL